MKANTIEEVIAHLDQIIQDSITEENPLGYFAALYQNVTIQVKESLGTHYFENDERMEKLDVIFANRYLEAYARYKEDKATTKSWAKAFNASKENKIIVLQHLLLGMNAHINLDLGIAAAEVSEPDTILDLKSDFNKINELLASLVNEVENDLAEIWPTLLKILKFFKKVDDFLVNFSMQIARDEAWKFATKIVGASPSDKILFINDKDEKVAAFSKNITKHGFFIRMIFWIIRLGERGSIADKIKLLIRKTA